MSLKGFEFFLLACNNGTLKLLKRKYREKLLKNVKETIFFKVKNSLYRKNSLYKKDFIELKDIEVKIKREMKELLFMSIIATVDDVDKFEKKRN